MSENTQDIKIHKDKVIYAATYIGGPLAGGYIIAENFKAFGDKENYRKSIIISVAFTIGLFLILAVMPDSINIPRFVIPFSYTFIAYWLIIKYQGKKIESHITNGGKTYSAWRAVLISIVSLAIMCAVAFPLMYYIGSVDQTEVFIQPNKSIRHEISYNSNNLDQGEVKNISQTLVNVNYLDTISTSYLYLDKDGKTIKISFPFIQPLWESTIDVDNYKELQKIVQSYYPNNNIELLMCDTALNVKYTIK